MTSSRRILLVEDNPADARLAKEVLREIGEEYRLYLVGSGDEAIQFLHRSSPFSSAPRPDLVLLDLNLPRMSGHEVLMEIKADSDLRRIPIVILSASQAEQDIIKSYDLHANCYICKSVNLDQFAKTMGFIVGFWFDTVRAVPINGA